MQKYVRVYVMKFGQTWLIPWGTLSREQTHFLSSLLLSFHFTIYDKKWGESEAMGREEQS